MPKKKSVKKSAEEFRSRADDLSDFLSAVSKGQTDAHVSWLYNYAIIHLYREFERLMLHTLVGAINNNTETISEVAGVSFPEHLTDEVCEYLIIGTGYFDFKGRDGLIQTIKKYVPNDHYLLEIVKKDKYREALGKLAALRNFAAHESSRSKKSALAAIEQRRLASSGSWLKRQGRFDLIKDRLKDLGNEIAAAAPY